MPENGRQGTLYFRMRFNRDYTECSAPALWVNSRDPRPILAIPTVHPRRGIGASAAKNTEMGVIFGSFSWHHKAAKKVLDAYPVAPINPTLKRV